MMPVFTPTSESPVLDGSISDENSNGHCPGPRQPGPNEPTAGINGDGARPRADGSPLTLLVHILGWDCCTGCVSGVVRDGPRPWDVVREGSSARSNTKNNNNEASTD